MKNIRMLIIIIYLFGYNVYLTAQDQSTVNRLNWFNEAKYGLFIHWGIYSIPAGEWNGNKNHRVGNGNKNHGEWIQYSAKIPGVEYEKLAKQFNPVKFNAKKWVSLAKQAGMKYIVITTKHHDGFCMYDSKLTNYDIVDATPYGKDPIKELAAECKNQEVKLCLYYSIKDWHHNNYPIKYTRVGKNHPVGYIGSPETNKPDYPKYLAYLRGQVKELLTNYGNVGIIWFDWPGSAFDYEEEQNRMIAQQLVDSIHKWQPACLINNRLGDIGADYGTPEQRIPGLTQNTAFEVCMTLNNHWGYNKYDNNWKSEKEIIYNLCDIASKGGNYLLNVGPTSEGVIPEESQDILRKVGKWLSINGDAIFGTTSGGPSVRWNGDIEMITTKPGTLYLHIFNYPDDHKFYLKDFTYKVKKAYLLADKFEKPLKVDCYPQGIRVHLPEKPINTINNIIVLKY